MTLNNADMRTKFKPSVVDVESDEDDCQNSTGPPSSPEPSDLDDNPALLVREVKTTTVTTVRNGVTTTTSEQVVTETFTASPTKRTSDLPRSGTPSHSRVYPPSTPSGKTKYKPAPKATPSKQSKASNVESTAGAAAQPHCDVPKASGEPDDSKPHPSTFKRPKGTASKYYAVTRGTKTGIFQDCPIEILVNVSHAVAVTVEYIHASLPPEKFICLIKLLSLFNVRCPNKTPQSGQLHTSVKGQLQAAFTIHKCAPYQCLWAQRLPDIEIIATPFPVTKRSAFAVVPFPVITRSFNDLAAADEWELFPFGLSA
ncbi:hypothetical protein H0H93_012307 [Arthromyces matolae]|nr:hypothetical protein H0H93_012307 [Arthromyces matolae]